MSSLPKVINQGVVNKVVQLFRASFFGVVNKEFLFLSFCFLFIVFSFLNEFFQFLSVPKLFRKGSKKSVGRGCLIMSIHSHSFPTHFLFIAYTFPFISLYFLCISYSLHVHFHTCLFISFKLRNLPNPKR